MAEEYVCPDSIEVKQALVTAPDGWAGMYENTAGEIILLDDKNGKEVSDKVNLSDVALYAGDPKDNALLAPDNEDELAEKDTDAIWTMASVEEQQKNPVYIACGYENSAIRIFKKTAAPVKSCKWLFNEGVVSNTVDCTPY
jgi:hypothetical protein